MHCACYYVEGAANDCVDELDGLVKEGIAHSAGLDDIDDEGKERQSGLGGPGVVEEGSFAEDWAWLAARITSGTATAASWPMAGAATSAAYARTALYGRAPALPRATVVCWCDQPGPHSRCGLTKLL